MANYPHFSAYNQNTEPHRLTRLQVVWDHAHKSARYYGNEELPSRVAELHDHKGILIVFWSRLPTVGEKEFFENAWQQVGDGTRQVEHNMDRLNSQRSS